MKKCLIVPYFGKFPNYFQLTLNSCKVNLEYDWIIFTDNNDDYKYPDNVIVYKMTFDEFKRKIIEKFDFDIVLDTPYKLCDYKVAYGYILEEYLEEYSWWGYCDLDIIFGKISNFITEEMLKEYDKLFVFGHFTLIKNTKENNRLFMEEYKKELVYKKYFTSNSSFAFDELWKNSINNIYENLNKKIFYENYSADIYPRKAMFKCVKLDIESKKLQTKRLKDKGIFIYENGKIKRYFIKNKKLVNKEYMYIHLQKRKMKIDENLKESYYKIIPNKFSNLEIELEELNVITYKKVRKISINKDFLRKLFRYNYLTKRIMTLYNSISKKIMWCFKKGKKI